MVELVSRNSRIILLIGLPPDGPNMTTIDHPIAEVPGQFTAALPPEADIGLDLLKRSANDPKATYFHTLTTQRLVKLITVRRSGFYLQRVVLSGLKFICVKYFEKAN